MTDKQNRIALNMIVKNEERFLRGCLESVKNLVDEIVIADTGSTDSTVAIASEYTDKVIHFTWTNDFAEARNFVLDHTESEWILYLDADERIDEKYHKQIREYVSSDAGDIFIIRQKNEAVEGKKKNIHLVPTPRLFKRIPEARFEGRIHEQIMSSLTKVGKKVVNTNIIMDHLGYLETEVRESKKQRNLNILIKQVENEPNNFFALHNLGKNYIAMGDWENGLPYLYKSLEQKDISLSIKSSIYLLLAKHMIQVKNYKEAINLCEKSLKIAPSQIYGKMLLSDALFYDNKIDKSIKLLKEGYQLSLIPEAEMKIDAPIESSYDPHYIQYLIAQRYRFSKQFDKAIEAYKKALSHKENYNEVHFELATLYFDRKSIEKTILHLDNIKLNEIDDSKLLLDMAGLYIELGKSLETRKVIERALEVDKENAKALFFLGNTYLDESNYDKAEECYLKSYNVDSTVKETILNLAFISIKKQDYEKALEYYKTLHSMYPEDESFARKIIGLNLKIELQKQ